MSMWGVRRSLGIKSMQAKNKERVLRRIGHVLGMESTRPTKRVTLGWFVPPVTPTPQRNPRCRTIEAGLDQMKQG